MSSLSVDVCDDLGHTSLSDTAPCESEIGECHARCGGVLVEGGLSCGPVEEDGVRERAKACELVLFDDPVSVSHCEPCAVVGDITKLTSLSRNACSKLSLTCVACDSILKDESDSVYTGDEGVKAVSPVLTSDIDLIPDPSPVSSTDMVASVSRVEVSEVYGGLSFMMAYPAPDEPVNTGCTFDPEWITVAICSRNTVALTTV